MNLNEKRKYKQFKSYILALLFIFSLPTLTSYATSAKIDKKVNDLIVIINNNFEDWEFEPNFRTVVVLDMGVIDNNNEKSQADYRPKLDEDSLKNDKIYDLADLIEIRNINTVKPRETVKTSGDSDYAYKLQMLINNNVMSRDSYYKIKDNVTEVSITREGEVKP